MSQNDQASESITTKSCRACNGVIQKTQEEVCLKCLKLQSLHQSQDDIKLTEPPMPLLPSQKAKASEEKVEFKRNHQQIQQISKHDPLRCGICKRKLGILGYQCNHCEVKYCKLHRLPENHECQVDFISIGRKKLKIQNPEVKSLKITPI